MRLQRMLFLTLVMAAVTAAPAQAQWVVTPYLGINLAGDAEFRRGGPGGSIGFLGGRVGLEFDFERYIHFFKDENVDSVPNDCAHPAQCVDIDTDAMSFMGNVVTPIGSTAAKWRPYVTLGVGVIHAWFDGPRDEHDTDQYNLAVNVGGGVMYSLNRRVAVRSDLRYFAAFVDEDKRTGGYHQDYGFLRATVGVTFRFPQ